MKKEDFLAQHTFSELGLHVHRRVLETVMQTPAMEPVRTAKLLGLLIERLVDQGALKPAEVDDLLMELV